MPNKINMRELGAKLGLSAITISRALRNCASVRPETRQRVVDAALKHGYETHPYFRALMSYCRARQGPEPRLPLAILNRWNVPNWRERLHAYRVLYEGCSSRANELGYYLEEIWMQEPGMTSDRINSILRSRDIRGVIVPPLPQAYGHISLKW